MAEANLTLHVDTGELRELLEEIRDRLPQAAQSAAKGIKASELAAAKREALRAVLAALDGWIEGAYENHDALGHRGENIGQECWRSFAPEDIRSMVNDAAQEIGLAPFLAPTDPVEDSW